MPSIFLSKHQKLILQCYPPGKGIDKKPNSSELSYLLYYASTRRVKLEKVIKFLYKKTTSDSNRNKFGNLQVTLSIVSSLIEKCSDNLNVFASEVVAILNLCLKNNDVSLSKAVLLTYGTFCKHLNSDLFVGDKSFVKAFQQFSSRIFEFGITNSNKSGPNQLEWKMISLISVRYTSYVIGYNPGFCNNFLSKAIPFLIESFHETQPEREFKSKSPFGGTSGSINGDGESTRLTKVALAKTAIVQHKIEEDLENDIIDKQDVHEESISGLKACFNTSLSSQISEATMQVVHYNYTSKNKHIQNLDWCNNFLQICTSWIPVQLRFVVLATLIANLKTLSTEKSNIEYQKRIAKFVLGLVSSNVNMIGLSISDFIQNILELKHYLYFEQTNHLLPEDLLELSTIYSQCIIKLSTHIYYFDQVPDSVNEIFIKIDSTLSFNENTGTSKSTQLFSFIINLLGDIQNILQDLRNKPTTINRNHVDLKHWEISLPLMASKSLTNLFNSLSVHHVEKIQLLYLELFEFFLDYEMNDDFEDETFHDVSGGYPGVDINITSNSSVNASVTSLNGLTIDRENLLNADYENMISNQTNFISNFLVYLDKYLINNPNINIEITTKLLVIAKLLTDKFGVNFLSNYLPFYFHWSTDINHFDASNEKLKLSNTFNDTCLQNILECLDTQYPNHFPSSYVSKSQLLNKLNNNIQYKVSNNYWSTDLSPVDTSISNTEGDNFDPIIKKDFQDFIKGNKFLSTWVNVDRPLVLSVLPDHITKDFVNDLDGEASREVSGNGDITYDTIKANGISNGNGYPNGFLNGNALGNGNATISSANSNSMDELKPSLGLGNTADIISIHSGLKHSNFNTMNSINNHLAVGGANSSFNTTNSCTEYNGSVYTNDKSKHLKVSDLKEMISDYSIRKPASLDDSSQVTPGSVLSKQMVAHDVGSIIDGLDSDDDSIVV